MASCWPEDSPWWLPHCQPSPSALPAGDEGSEDYQNSASIQQWQESRKVLGMWLESSGSREVTVWGPGGPWPWGARLRWATLQPVQLILQ